MANKVISIKMDESDIERIRKYHEILIRLGIVSEKTLSMNALYKHLLLDYIAEDIRCMLSACNSCGLTPIYVNPEALERKEISLSKRV